MSNEQERAYNSELIAHSSLRALPWRRLILAILLVAISTLPFFLVAASFVHLEDDIGLTTTTLGFLSASFFVTAAVSSATLGRLVDRIGWKTAMRVNVIGSASVLLAIALFARSVAAFALRRITAGVFFGLSNPSANKALAEQVDPSRRGTIFGLKHAGIPGSTLLAGLAIPIVVVNVGWPAAFAAGVLLAPVVWALIATDRGGHTPIAAEAPSRGARQLTTRHLASLAGAASLSAWAAASLGTFMVAGAVEEASLSESAAGMLLFAGSLATITARVSAGVVTDRVGGRGFGGLALLMGAGGLVFLLLIPSTGAAFVVLVLVAFATGWAWPGLLTFTIANANAKTVASSTAIGQAGTFLGAGLAPVLLGWIIENSSFQTSWLLVSVALLTAAVIVTIVGMRTQRPEPARTRRSTRFRIECLASRHRPRRAIVRRPV